MARARRAARLGLVTVAAMRRLLLVLALVLAFPSVAQAHSYWHLKPFQANRLEERIVTYRAHHGEPGVFPGFMNAMATVALQHANYAEHKWSTTIAGVPYFTWAAQYFPSGHSVMLSSIRPHGAPWTPRMVLNRWKHKPVYKAALLDPVWTKISVRAGDIHQHKGAYKGKGRCRVYYVSLSAL